MSVRRKSLKSRKPPIGDEENIDSESGNTKVRQPLHEKTDDASKENILHDSVSSNIQKTFQDLSMNESDSVSQNYIQECKDLWETLKNLQEQAENSQIENPISLEEADPSHTILLSQEKRLVAELNAKQEQNLSIYPTGSYELTDSLKNELRKSVEQMEIEHQLYVGKKTELEKSLSQEQHFHDEFLQVNMALRKISERADPEISQEDIYNEFSNRYKAANLYMKALMKQLMTFVEEHFSQSIEDSGSDTSSRETRRKRRSANVSLDHLSLLTMLQELMNKCIESPHDPYIGLDDTYSEPYVALLVRCKIAVKHPQDSNRLRLVAFYL